MGVAENVAAVSDFIERAWNRGDESVFQEHLSPEFPFPGGPDEQALDTGGRHSDNQPALLGLKTDVVQRDAPDDEVAEIFLTHL